MESNDYFLVKSSSLEGPTWPIKLRGIFHPLLFFRESSTIISCCHSGKNTAGTLVSYSSSSVCKLHRFNKSISLCLIEDTENISFAQGLNSDFLIWFLSANGSHIILKCHFSIVHFMPVDISAASCWGLSFQFSLAFLMEIV